MGYALLLGMENRADQEKGEEYHSRGHTYIAHAAVGIS